jgi:plasmid stability protein
MFGHYYLPDILTMQMAGEEMTKSAAFIATHKGSEINFKIFSLALLVLIVQNMRKACK